MPFQEYSNCCDNQTNIVWLNRQGGYQNYIFTGVKTFSVDTGDSKTFIKDGVKSIYQRKEVREGFIVSTSIISKAHVDYLDSLRYSIQCWEWNDSTNVFKKLLIDEKTFTKYTSRNNEILDVFLRFYYADELTVQTQ